jgi:transposase-like protein
MGVMERRKRRAFTKEFKAETIRLVVDGKRTVGEVARDLDLTESALRLWVHQAEVDAGRGKPGELTTAEREELQQLRREVKTLRLEREILKKAAAFFAKENG